jgi:hypothetical protein
MAIGTSTGEYYDDEFQHAAGVGKEYGSELYKEMDDHKEGKDLPDVSELPTDTISNMIYKMGSDALRAIHSVATGQVPGWEMNPETGEFHTSPEMMESAGAVLPFINGTTFSVGRGTPGIPTSLKLVENPETLPSGEEYWNGIHEENQQSLISNLRRQVNPETGTMGVEDSRLTTPTPRYDPAWETADLRLAEPNPFDPNSPDQTERVLHAIHEALNGPEQQAFERPISLAQEPFNLDAYDRPAKYSPGVQEKIKALRADKSPSELVKDESGNFFFANEKGVGQINASYRSSRKEIRVHSMGLAEDSQGNRIDPLSYQSMREGPQTFGIKDQIKVLRLLKEQYPDAQWISGFRVSGARLITGSGSNEAKMWVGNGPRPEPTARENSIQRVRDFLDRVPRLPGGL